MEAECAHSWSSETQPDHPVGKGPATREPGGSEGGTAKDQRANGVTAWCVVDTAPFCQLAAPRTYKFHPIPPTSSLCLLAYIHPPCPHLCLAKLTSLLTEKRGELVWLGVGSDLQCVLSKGFHCYSSLHYL